MGIRITKSNQDLDTAWKQQNREQKENQMYKLINLQRGGELIRIYEDEGPEALQTFIRERVEPLLYNAGKGHMLHKVDYVRWKKKGEAKLKVGVIFSYIQSVVTFKIRILCMILG